ncbi:kinetochore-associated protein NSL1 homolog isoform X2 [Brachionichthys hirsutus]|uniref:kinetochore-associated protein NSL1 homolog isoform X2 n=1 Tax=Brachionichthys hirsutus TaxID=412623 RepID=UPI00360435C4
METAGSETLHGDDRSLDYRVRVPSKKRVIDHIDRYKDILLAALDAQKDVEEETKGVLLRDLLANFEAAVQDNVLVNGQPWEEAPDVEELESLLDDAIVDTTCRRRSYPKYILPHVIHTLKAKRKLMYGQCVDPPLHANDPDREAIMKGLSAAAPAMVKQAKQVMESIRSIHKQAEGLCEIVNMKSSSSTLEIHREVFGFQDQSVQRLPVGMRSRQEMKRAADEAGASDCYVSASKKMAPQ